jgi:hypothetical protein
MPAENPNVRSKPEDVAIINALAYYFQVQHITVLRWLKEMDLEALKGYAEASQHGYNPAKFTRKDF